MRRYELLAAVCCPVTVYYCKAGLKTGRTVRVLQGTKVYETAGVSIYGAAASMFHDNAKGKPKASGARCVMLISDGIVRFEGGLL